MTRTTVTRILGRWLTATACLPVVLIGGFTADPGDAGAATTFTYVKIVDSYTPLPGGGTAGAMGQPSLSDGVVAFTADFGSGIYTRTVNDPASLAMRYNLNTPVPGSGGTARFGLFYGPSFNKGSVAFRAERYTPSFVAGVYTDVGGVLQRVADTSTPIPGGSGTFTLFGRPWLSRTDVVFRALGASQDGIYAWSGGVLRRVADKTTPVPGGTGHFVSFGGVDNSGACLFGIPATYDGIVVFRGTGSAGERGVYEEVGGVLQVVADLNTPIPGGTGNFTGFELSVLAGNIDDGTIIFGAEGASGQRGLYAHDGASLSLVIDTHTFVPGTNATFTYVAGQGMGFDNGNVSFLGDATSGPQAVYAVLGGVLRTVVVNEQILDGKVSFAFGTYGRGIDGNMIAFLVGNYGGTPGQSGDAMANYVAIASNAVPVAVADTLIVSEGGSGTVNVLANDTDSDGDVLTVDGFTHGAHGTVSCTSAGACTYTTSDSNFNGTDSFSYKVTDGRAGFAVGTVSVTVFPVDDADVAIKGLTVSEDPAGRGRTLTYMVTVVTPVPRRPGPSC